MKGKGMGKRKDRSRRINEGKEWGREKIGEDEENR